MKPVLNFRFRARTCTSFRFIVTDARQFCRALMIFRVFLLTLFLMPYFLFASARLSLTVLSARMVPLLISLVDLFPEFLQTLRLLASFVLFCSVNFPCRFLSTSLRSA